MLSGSELLHGSGLAALIVYLFLGISVLCDEHLCPVLERLCTQFRLPTALAGATLLAFGSSAPEIIIGACGAASNQTELSIPTILVSALIAFGAIPPLVVAAVGSITVDGAGVFRDAIAYGLSVGLLLYFDQQSEIGLFRAGILSVGYLVYLLFIWWTSPSAKEEAEKARADLVVASALEEAGKSNGDTRTSNGSTGSNRRVSTWLTALAEKDIVGVNGERLGEPLLRSATLKDDRGAHRGPHQKFPACSPINEGASPFASSSVPNFGLPPTEDRSTSRTPSGYSVGKSYQVESLVTMRAGEDLTSDIKGEFKEGTVVRILQLTSGRRAKVAIGSTEGWVSLVTAYGETLIGQAVVEEEQVSHLLSEAETENDESEEEPATLCDKFQAALYRPFTLVFEKSIPENPAKAFAVCLVYLALLSEGALFFAGVLADVWRISGATAGMTLLAFGGQIPDAIAAVELARSGMPDAAVAQAVASQVINITLGVGMPFFIYTCITGLPTQNNHPTEIFTIASSLGVVIAAYFFLLLSGMSSGGKVTINNCKAVLLMLAFGVCYIYAIGAVEMSRWASDV